MGSIRGEVHVRGFAFRPAYHQSLVGEALARLIGSPMALGPNGPLHTLTPAPAAERAPNTYSGLYGLGAFPLHTDLAHHRSPPRYLTLRSLVPDPSVTTTLVDGAEIVAAVGASFLSRALVQPRRPRAGLRPLLRLFDPTPPLIRWDIEFIRPASAVGAEAVAAFGNALERREPEEIRFTQPGDILVVDNWRMLHGRSAVPQVSRDRRIERVYLESLN